MNDTTTCRIKKELNRLLTIYSILERKKKEEFTAQLLDTALEPYKKKYAHKRFS